MPTTDMSLWLSARADVYLPIDCSRPLTSATIASLVGVCDRIENSDGESVVVLHVTGEPSVSDQGNQWPGPQANIQVNFASLGVKIMMLEYLEVVR